ncbi:hypothetical protein QEZ54_18615 [Catellatospora sp. KI3]|uniref:hypothetical protein n=1 Tax=Catellatospora sp. KI3 TaxID=3041620 RepID=UPI00248253F5|nr:hypothetical protein [Catellatospora sp. KI3]MDI1462993.1 hypothetical protein [Catellatospora sp. KI3]
MTASADLWWAAVEDRDRWSEHCVADLPKPLFCPLATIIGDGGVEDRDLGAQRCRPLPLKSTFPPPLPVATAVDDHHRLLPQSHSLRSE